MNLFLLTTISIIVLLIISPIVNGAYGSNFSNAVEISAGITNDQFQDGDNVGYYKISCTSSTMMDIRFNCTYSYQITLIVYDPDQIQVANNTYYGSGFYARILLTCSKSG